MGNETDLLREIETVSKQPFYGRNHEPIADIKCIASHGVYGLVFSGRYADEQQPSVAIKVLKRGQNTESNREAFRAEAQTLEDLTLFGSTHTPTVHNFHDDESGLSLPYMVMDLAKGVKLGELAFDDSFVIRDSKTGSVLHYDQQTALEITTQLLETLKIADQAGYAYRDWKAYGGSMLWDTNRKNLMIIDWGTTDPATAETRKDMVSNSLRVLYTLVTNQIYLGKGPGLDQQGQPVKLWESVSPGIRRLLEKGLSQNPQDRYTDFDEVIRDLNLLKTEGYLLTKLLEFDEAKLKRWQAVASAVSPAEQQPAAPEYPEVVEARKLVAESDVREAVKLYSNVDTAVRQNRAIERYKRTPIDDQELNRLDTVLRDLGVYLEPLLEAALAHDPYNPRNAKAYEVLSEMLKIQNKKKKAIETYQHYLELSALAAREKFTNSVSLVVKLLPDGTTLRDAYGARFDAANRDSKGLSKAACEAVENLVSTVNWVNPSELGRLSIELPVAWQKEFVDMGVNRRTISWSWNQDRIETFLAARQRSLVDQAVHPQEFKPALSSGQNSIEAFRNFWRKEVLAQAAELSALFGHQTIDYVYDKCHDQSVIPMNIPKQIREALNKLPDQWKNHLGPAALGETSVDLPANLQSNRLATMLYHYWEETEQETFNQARTRVLLERNLASSIKPSEVVAKQTEVTPPDSQVVEIQHQAAKVELFMPSEKQQGGRGGTTFFGFKPFRPENTPPDILKFREICHNMDPFKLGRVAHTLPSWVRYGLSDLAFSEDDPETQRQKNHQYVRGLQQGQQDQWKAEYGHEFPQD